MNIDRMEFESIQPASTGNIDRMELQSIQPASTGVGVREVSPPPGNGMVLREAEKSNLDKIFQVIDKLFKKYGLAIVFVGLMQPQTLPFIMAYIWANELVAEPLNEKLLERWIYPLAYHCALKPLDDWVFEPISNLKDDAAAEICERINEAAKKYFG